MTVFYRYFLVALCAIFVQFNAAHASTYPNATAANRTTLLMGAINAGNVGQSSFGAVVNNAMVVVSQQPLALSNGSSIALSVTGAVPKASVMAALGRFAGRAIPLASTGVALYQLGNELDYLLTNKADGTIDFQKNRDVVDCSSGCTVYGNADGTFTSSASSACTTYNQRETLSQYRVDYSPYNGNLQCRGAVYNKSSNPAVDGTLQGYSIFYLPSKTVPESTHKEYMPSTRQEFLDEIASKAGWPSSSAIAQATADAIKDGATVNVEPKSITGPSSSPGSKSVTQDAVKNQTTTNTTTNNYKYDGNTITVTTSTSSVTVDNSTGDVVNNTTTESEDADYSYSDSNLPALPTLYEQKYPDGLKGVWATKKSEMTASPLVGLLSYLMPTVSGGSCPVIVLNMDVGIYNFGTHDISPPCAIWTFGKWVIIISALLLARSLVFGG